MVPLGDLAWSRWVELQGYSIAELNDSALFIKFRPLTVTLAAIERPHAISFIKHNSTLELNERPIALGVIE